jgi:hypothetical protein
MNEPVTRADRVKAYTIVTLIVAFILAYAAAAYLAIGTRGPARWNYGSRVDVPGESVYSTHPYSTAYLHKAWITSVLMGITLDFNRMRLTEFYRPFKAKMPDVPAGAVPVDGGEEVWRQTHLGGLANPLPNDADTVRRGHFGYVYFCIHCHGSLYNGDGTVGQSFSPLPADLRSARVQNMGDDDLFRRISYGKEFLGPDSKVPPLCYTVSVDDRWRIIWFLRSLGVRGPSTEPRPSGDFPGKTYYPVGTTTRSPLLPK